MGTGALAGGASVIFHAQIAFRGLAYGLEVLAQHEPSFLIADIHHSNCIVWAVQITGFAADAGSRIDHDLTFETFAMDRSSWTANHANRIGAVHARVSDH